MIEIKEVSKRYNEVLVVDHVSLDIPKGNLTAFIGSNGAGKSTLLSMVSRLISMNSGQIIIDKLPIDQWDSNALAKKISILRQSNHMNLRLTIRELVAFGRYPYSKGQLTQEDHDKIDEAISYMELDAIQDKYLDQLSGGQRQMAFIAMIIAQDTEYIFLDEPLNNLDMKHSVKIMKTLRHLVDHQKKTIVVVIHDINFVSCYADHVLALKDGKMVKYGEVNSIIHPEVLHTIYDMPITIERINHQNICVFYA